MPRVHGSDEEQIRALIGRQFESIGCGRAGDAGWMTFHRDVIAGEWRFPGNVSAGEQNPRRFDNRLGGERAAAAPGTSGGKFVGCHAWIFGNIAVALAGCEMGGDGLTTAREIAGYLLIRYPDGWKIAAQAWDTADNIAEAFANAGLSPEP